MQLEELINKNYAQLNENDHDIWRYISEHKQLCTTISIDHLANNTHFSRSTILRFCKRLGLNGFSEFKVYLRLDLERKTHYHNLDKLFDNYHLYMEEIKQVDLSEVVECLGKANTIYVYGTGSIQNNVAEEFKRSFLMVGKIVFNIKSHNETDNYASIMEQGDVVVIISYSGEGQKVLQFAKQLRTKGVILIAITVSMDNTLAHLAHYSLYVKGARMPNPEGAPYEGLVNYFILMDGLVAAYIENLGENKHVR